jgi:hypothetical protein
VVMVDAAAAVAGGGERGRGGARGDGAGRVSVSRRDVGSRVQVAVVVACERVRRLRDRQGVGEGVAGARWSGTRWSTGVALCGGVGCVRLDEVTRSGDGAGAARGPVVFVP